METPRRHGRRRSHGAPLRRVAGDVRLCRMPLFGRDSALPSDRRERSDRPLGAVTRPPHVGAARQRAPARRARGHVQQAFIATEDRRFYEHNGLDWRARDARGRPQRVVVRRARGVQHHHDAGRAQHLHVAHRPRALAAPQAARAALRAADRAQPHQGRRSSSSTSTSSTSATACTASRPRAATCSARASGR